MKDNNTRAEGSFSICVSSTPTVSLTTVSGYSTVNGDSVVLKGTIDTDEPVGYQSVVVAWGDGSSTTVSLAPGAGAFLASHVYPTDGPMSYTATVTVTMDDASLTSTHTAQTVSASTAVSLTVGSLTVSLLEAPASGESGAIVYADVCDPGEFANDFTYVWNVTDQTTDESVDVGNSDNFIPNAADDYSVAVKVTDEFGNSGEASGIILADDDGDSGSDGESHSGSSDITIPIDDDYGDGGENGSSDGSEDPPVVTIEAEGSTIDGGGDAAYYAVLSKPALHTVRVTYSAPAVGADSATVSGTAWIPAGETAAFLSYVPTLADNLTAGTTENLVMSIDSVTAASQGSPSSVTVSIVQTAPTVSIASDGAVPEDENADFSVSLNAPANFPVKVNYSFTDGTAINGTDYRGASGTVTIPAGETSATISARTLPDLDIDGDLNFTAQISSPTGASLDTSSATATGIITHDRPTVTINDVTVDAGDTAVFTVSLSETSKYGVKLEFHTEDGTAIAGTDYIGTSGAGSDASPGADKTLWIFPGSYGATIEIPTNDQPDDDSLDFQVVLNNFSGAIGSDSSGTIEYCSDTTADGTGNETGATGTWVSSDTWAETAEQLSPTSGAQKVVYSGHAKAVGGPASLKALANDITGNSNDWTLIASRGQGEIVPAGTIIDISPLLNILDVRIRDGVVAAADSDKGDNFKFGLSDATRFFDESEIESVFDGTSDGSADCTQMVELELCAGIISVLNPGEFDELGLLPNLYNSYAADAYMSSWSAPLSNLKPGDWVTFVNYSGYTEDYPQGAWRAENTIMTVRDSNLDLLDKFYGWGAPEPLTADGWVNKLWQIDNQNRWITQIYKGQIPGYNGEDQFLNIASLAHRIFNLRTGVPLQNPDDSGTGYAGF